MAENEENANNEATKEVAASEQSGVRIFGAEQVGVTKKETPAHHAVASPIELQHWTDAPTGQVPAVVAHEVLAEGEEGWGQLPAPSWREGEEDWAVEETEVELTSLHGEEPKIGSNAAQEAVARSPWIFDVAEGGDDGTHSGEDVWEFAAENDERGDKPTPQKDVEKEVRAEEIPQSDLPTARELLERAAAKTGGLAGLGAPAGFNVRLADEAPKETVQAETAPKARSRHARRGAPSTPTVSASRRLVRHIPTHSPQVVVAEPEGKRNIPLSILTGLILGVGVLAFFYFGTVPAMVLIGVVVTLGGAEALAAFRRGGFHPATPVALLAIAGMVVGAYNESARADAAVLVVAFVATVAWQIIGVDKNAEPFPSILSTLYVVLWVGVFGSFAGLLLSPSAFPHRNGIAYLLCAILVTVGADVGALVFGSWIGKHPLTAFSPKKTWEGAIGGGVVAIVVGIAFGHATHPLNLEDGLYIGIAAAILAPIGDLGESILKRFLDIKDIGQLLPGHGGILDRIDGLLFVLPATYFLVEILHVGS